MFENRLTWRSDEYAGGSLILEIKDKSDSDRSRPLPDKLYLKDKYRPDITSKSLVIPSGSWIVVNSFVVFQSIGTDHLHFYAKLTLPDNRVFEGVNIDCLVDMVDLEKWYFNSCDKGNMKEWVLGATPPLCKRIMS